MSERVESEIGLIPKEWVLCSVGELIATNILEKPLDGNHGEKHPKGTDFKNEGVPFIMATDINDGKIDLVNCKFIDKRLADSLDKGFSIEGDVLLTHKASLGRTAIVTEIKMPYIMLTPQVTYYRVKNTNKLNNHFLKYFFDSPVFQDTLLNHGDSGSTRAYVGITAQRDLPILLPPLPEQKAIASVLSSLDDKIDLLHRQNKTLEAMAETLFRQWFVEEADESWEEGTIADLIEFNPNRKLPKGSAAPYLEMSALSNNTFNPRDWYDREFSSGTKFINGDTLLARITPCLENGKAAFVTFLDEDQVAWGSTEFIVMRPKLGLHPFFAYVLARTDDFKDYAEGCLEGSSDYVPVIVRL
ncbi:restriction endonuclease subunit S [Leptonema illini]|uniref:Restriction modification system DNA specificity domain-containing protein n=1 Tax=Leptonema illini DSM 21528 TaxID=929563 RepID=H2CGZ8_9LEPT|nr:restriction endonuclease subunit S [Leptonema illini]EHQ05840.1 restriction modification system DNA specificity domain-containing protein [Leptonema illini DSM 21528]